MNQDKEIYKLLGRSKSVLKPFGEILTELEWALDDIDKFKALDILELGPGNESGLLKSLSELCEKGTVAGVGISSKPLLPWRKVPKSVNIQRSLILPYLRELEASSLDLIYSRHVLELHSMDARLLIRHPEYKKAIRENAFQDLPESFPAGQKNILAIFAACYRALRPGGILITQVAKRKFAVLTEAGLQSFEPSKLRFRSLGRLSEISTFVK